MSMDELFDPQRTEQRIIDARHGQPLMPSTPPSQGGPDRTRVFLVGKLHEIAALMHRSGLTGAARREAVLRVLKTALG